MMADSERRTDQTAVLLAKRKKGSGRELPAVEEFFRTLSQRVADSHDSLQQQFSQHVEHTSAQIAAVSVNTQQAIVDAAVAQSANITQIQEQTLKHQEKSKEI